MKRLGLAFGLVFGLAALGGGLLGCTKATDDGSSGPALIDGFTPPPVATGYARYVTPPVQILPGQDLMFCQWIDVSAADDVDVIAVNGYQTVTGHHAILYSSSEIEPVGTSRLCTTDDMVSVQFLGGVGGEGAGSVTKLPDGVVFRQHKGRTLMANTHYLNATDSVQQVQSVLDVKLAAPSPQYTPAGMAVINYLDFHIPANTPSYSVDAYCTWPRDTSLVMWSNHMHSAGLSSFTDVKHLDGTTEMMAADPSWTGEEAFNPNWFHWELGAPRMIHAGDQMHINCTWQNTGSTSMRFPDEMCDGAGFYLEGSDQVVCDASTTPTL